MTLASGRINSSPIVNNFLDLAMRLTTKNDALSADTFHKVKAFNNCFCSSWSHFFFFKKNPKALSFNAGCLVSMWQSSFKGFKTLLGSWSPRIIQSSIGECDHLLE